MKNESQSGIQMPNYTERRISVKLLLSASLILPIMIAAIDAQTLPGTVKYSWLGNTFSGNPGWVPQDADDIFVHADGTVYTNIPWEENGANVSAFKNGAFVGMVGEAEGSGNGYGGTAVTANERYVFFGADRWKNIVRRNRSNLREGHVQSADLGGEVTGLVATATLIYASVASLNKIIVLDTALLKQGEWLCNACGKLALDNAEKLWVVQGASIISYATNGTATGKKLEPAVGVEIGDIAADTKGRLIVADRGWRCQIMIYTDLTTSPRLEKTFGEEKGVFAGPVPGVIGEKRFYAPRGVGIDSVGNLYVCNGKQLFNGGTALLGSYGADGSLKWRIGCTVWLDKISFDPESDGRDAYSRGYHFKLDFSKPSGQEAEAYATTTNGYEFPNLFGAIEPKATYFWKYNGVRFQANASEDGLIEINRFRDNTEQLTRCGAGAGPLKSTSRGARADEQGTLWYPMEQQLFVYPIEKIGPAGCPSYSSSGVVFNVPAFTKMCRVRYLPSKKELWISGYTQQYPQSGYHFNRAGVVLRKYSNWTLDAPNWTASAELIWPHEIVDGGNFDDANVVSFDVAGDYLFGVACGADNPSVAPDLGVKKRGQVWVYDNRTLKLVGAINPPNNFGNIGIQDLSNSIETFKRSNGEYLITIEDDGKQKVIMYRWCPEGNCPENLSMVTPAARHPVARKPMGGAFRWHLLNGRKVDFTAAMHLNRAM